MLAAKNNTLPQLPEKYSSTFSQNDVTGWNPSECDSGQNCVPPTGDQITWIGDSYSVFVDNQGLLSERFPGVDIGPSPNNTPSSYIQGSKFVGWHKSDNPSCLNILEGIIKSGNLRPYLVFACGTNGGWSDGDISEFQNLLKDTNTKAVVVNSRMRSCYAGLSCDPEFKDSNALLKAMADSNDDIYLADWASAYDPSYYVTDPVHPYDNPGGEKWVEVIADALPQNCTDDGQLLPGTNVAEKIWNWLVNNLNSQGLSGKDIPAIVSGIMGNFYSESGLNPLMASSGYYGLYMLYGPYGGNVYVSQVNSALGGNYFKFYGWWDSEFKVDTDLANEGLSSEQIDNAISINLETLVNGSNWAEFMDGVRNWGVADTPRGYSDLFLVTVERAVGGNSPIEDPGVLRHYSGLYQGSDKRRDNAQHFYDQYASSTSINPNVTDSDGATESSGSNQNYAGETVWDEEQMALIEEYKPVYESASQQYGIPWQALATMHRLEHGLALDNPANGQGIYQLYSYTDGGTNSNAFLPAGPVDMAEFQRQTNIAAEIMKGMIESGGYEADSDAGIKYLLFSYNGRASVYIQKALSMGFSQEEADTGEGSPYVMNRYDAKRDPNSSEMDPNWPGRYVADGVYDPSSTMYDFGGFVLYSSIKGESGDSDMCEEETEAPEYGNLIEYVKAYVAPEYHGINYGERTPDYDEAVKRRQSEGKFIGGTDCGIGADCGGFVTTILNESGFDPEYNSQQGNTNSQELQLASRDDWELINPDFYTPISDASELSPGDVAFSNCSGGAGSCGHTYLFIGEIDGFEYPVASAAYCFNGGNFWMPQVTTESITYYGGVVHWWHKIK